MKNFFQGEIHKLWWILTQTRDAIWKARIRELHKSKLTPNRSAVLTIVHALKDDAIPSEIARWIFREPHSISELLSRMQQEGIVRRVDRAEDGREVSVKITENGIRLLSEASKRESIYRIFSVLTDKERETLLSLLLKLRERAMTEIGQIAPLPDEP